jgi:hypothetical protein
MTMPRFRFTIRDVLWLTVVVALAVGWWMDRSFLAWRHDRSVTTSALLLERLDEADPGWQMRSDSRGPAEINLSPISPATGYGIAAVLLAIAILILVLVWRGQLHWSLLEEKPRI